jgi:hypothetical protein
MFSKLIASPKSGVLPASVRVAPAEEHRAANRALGPPDGGASGCPTWRFNQAPPYLPVRNGR